MSDKITPDPEVLTCARCRHEFYETDDRLTLSIFDRGVDPADVKIKFEPRAVSPNPENRGYRFSDPGATSGFRAVVLVYSG